MHRIRPILLVFVLAALAGGGCYTMLRHPATHDMVDVHGTQRPCADCHVDEDLYGYTEAYGSSWYSYYPAPWASYYGNPWWYDDYWYYRPGDDAPVLPPAREGRNVWSRSGGGPGFIPYQGNPSPDSPPSGKEERSRSDDEDEKPEKKKEKKRNLWGR
ncbi:MAG: hypothetical protein GF346_08005 [Candidatus Eisenbacteria bacterium]|nr:hypothetical protein [Candidatus Latescibacterota bacterium]MBD3302376.1 hypothetical protein [Candidatus Eisenbacteria bacterium]